MNRAVHDDDLDRRVLLPLHPLVVLREELAGLDLPIGFIQLERIRERNPLKGNIALLHTVLGRFLGVDGFDVDRRDVVAEQHDFVGKELLGVLAVQVLRSDQPGLQQPGHEGAGADEAGSRIETPSSERDFPNSSRRAASAERRM